MNGMRRLYAEPSAHTAPTEQSGGKKTNRTNEREKKTRNGREKVRNHKYKRRSKLLWQNFETGQLYVYEFVNKQ